MRYVSLFSGIEAASVAWEPLGWEPVAFSEIEPFPCAVLKERFPDVPNLGDVSKIDWSTYSGAVDLVVGGSPCQAFSVAGKRKGLMDTRGQLMLEYVRAVREIRPKWVVWENVPGVLSQDGGRAFGTLLGELENCGYSLAWRVLDAQFAGVAQRRRRVFAVGHLGSDGYPAAVLFERDSLRWDSASSREKRKELARASGSGARDGDRAGSAWSVMGNVCDRDARPNGSGASGEVWDASPTLRAGASCGNQAPCVAFSAGQSDKAGSVGAQIDVAPTLRAGASGTNQVPTVCMASTQANAEIEQEMCPTMAARQHKDPPVLFARGVPFEVAWRWPWVVRRLMPVECERLQGFPDGWTAIPYRGKPAEECPDTPRYKALGNSMAVPEMRWIGERIAMVEEIMGEEGA